MTHEPSKRTPLSMNRDLCANVAAYLGRRMELDQLGRMDIAVDLPPPHDQGVNANRTLDGRFLPDDQDSVAEHLALEDAVDPRSAFEKELPLIPGSSAEKCVDDGFVVLHRRGLRVESIEVTVNRARVGAAAVDHPEGPC